MTAMTEQQAIRVLRGALEAIENPIVAMQREVPEGCVLNAHMAVQMADDPEWYKRRAREALAATAAIQPAAAPDERELIEAAEALVARWYTPKWKDEPHTAVFIERLRAALSNSAAPAQADARDATLEEDGVSLIAAERRRQVGREGWSAKHDDEHEDASLAMAAALYASPEPLYTVQKAPNSVAWTDPWPWHDQVQGARGGWHKVPAWDKRKTHPRLRQLVIAGALIAAEIDRLNRTALRTTSTPTEGNQP